MEDSGMSTVMVWTLSGVIGVISSLVASGVFLLAISKLRPKLFVSPKISKTKDDKGNTVYFVKVINRTRYPVIGVNVRMYLATPQNVSGGTAYKHRAIELRMPNVMELSPFDRKDKDAKYAVRFTVAEDLDALWSQDETARVRFQIYATHSLTGFGKAVDQFYYQKRTDLVDGEFKFGNSLEIV
jgi:hypothetical protein